MPKSILAFLVAVVCVVPAVTFAQSVNYTRTDYPVGVYPTDIAFDTAGNLYVANNGTNNISKITHAGVVTTFATVGANPYSLAFDTAGNLYVANSGANNISKITPAGAVTTFATVASPHALAFDTAGNLYTANFLSNTISKITPAGVVTTATVGANPYSLAFDTAGNLYVANSGANNISKITPAGAVTTFATVGATPAALAFDTAGNLYVANLNSSNISKITPAGAVTTFATVASPHALAFDTSTNSIWVTLAPSAPPYSAAQIDISTGVTIGTYTVGNYPISIALDRSTNSIWTANFFSDTVTKLSPPAVLATVPGVPTLGTVTAGNGSATLAFTAPSSTGGSAITGYTATCGSRTATGTGSPIIVTGLANGTSYSCSVSASNTVGAGASSNAIAVTPVAATVTYAVGARPAALAFDTAGNLYTANYASSSVSKITPAGIVTTFATVGNAPDALAFDTAGNLYVANNASNNISKITPAGTVTTLATVTPGPASLVFDTAGNLYASGLNPDTAGVWHNTVSKVTMTSGTAVSTNINFATLAGPTSIGSYLALAFDTAGNLYFANGGSNNIAKITPAGVVATFATVGNYPVALAFDTAGNLYTSNINSSNISKITPAGVVTIFATVGSLPTALTFDTASNLYVANLGTNNITKITPAGVVTIFATVGSLPDALAFDTAGNLYVANSGSNTVSKIPPTGSSGAVAPSAPVLNTVTAGNGQATLNFTAPTNDGGSSITGYTATCGSRTATGTVSPIIVTGLTNGTQYACTVIATNSAGSSVSSNSINVTPSSSALGATLTINGQQNATDVDPLVSRTWAWSSTPATGLTATASYSITNCDTSSRNVATTNWTPWTNSLHTGNSLNGSSAITSTTALYGCTMNATYTVTNTSSQTATANSLVTFKHLAAAAPTITSFTVTPTTVQSGGTLTFNWSASGAANCTISASSGYSPQPPNVVSNAAATGSATYTPSTSLTYTIICNNSAGTPSVLLSSHSVYAPVAAVGPTPTITSFTVSPTTVQSGGTLTFNWASRDAANCTIIARTITSPQPGNVITDGAASGSVSYTPQSTITYTLTCKNSAGVTSPGQSIRVAVAEASIPAPTIISVTSGANSAIVKFSKLTGVQVDGYVATCSWGYSPAPSPVTGSASNDTITVGLNPGGYDCSVQAYVGSAYSQPSASLHVTVTSTPTWNQFSMSPASGNFDISLLYPPTLTFTLSGATRGDLEACYEVRRHPNPNVTPNPGACDNDANYFSFDGNFGGDGSYPGSGWRWVGTNLVGTFPYSVSILGAAPIEVKSVFRNKAHSQTASATITTSGSIATADLPVPNSGGMYYCGTHGTKAWDDFTAHPVFTYCTNGYHYQNIYDCVPQNAGVDVINWQSNDYWLVNRSATYMFFSHRMNACTGAMNSTAPANQYASAIGAFSQVSAPATPPKWTYTWERDLEIGSPYTEDVSALQTALTKEGTFAGEVTGRFYAQTYLAVKAFQTKYGIDSTGFVGPKTRATLNGLYK